jgi:hypothetical protein
MSRRDPTRCKLCGFTLGHDEGLADQICDSCDLEIVEHQRESAAQDADDDAWDQDDEIDLWNRGDAANYVDEMEMS